MTQDKRVNATELLQRAFAGSISPAEFEQELWCLSKGHQRRARIYESGVVRIYRSRTWQVSKRPTCTADLSYPPKDCATLGRANLAGEQIFYASAGLPPSFVECRLSKGQYVVCSEWRNTANLVLQEVGLSLGKNTSSLEQIYHQIFTSGDPGMYIYSAHVAHHLLSGDSISGLLYPSIAAQSGSHNVALKPSVVDTGMRFVNASLYYVKDVAGAHQYEVEEIDFALPQVDGSLDWKGRKRQWTIRKQGDQLKFVSNGWTWDAYQPDGSLVDPE